MKTITRLCALVLLAACAQATSAPLEARVGQTVDLAVGETARIQNSNVTVRFSSANDSRCPSDVVCVTAGDAAITVLLTGAGSERSEAIYLTRDPRAATYGGYRFEAVELLPYPKSTGQGTDKTVTLRITQAP
jgi:hypothetical protein